MDHSSGVYVIENLRTGACYIGGTRNGFLPRWLCHRAQLSLGHHYNQAFQEDWNILGAGWFKFVALEEIDPSIMTAADEQRWLTVMKDQGRFCYNRVPVFSYPVLTNRSQTSLHMNASEVARCLGLPNPIIPGLPDDQPVLTVPEVAKYFLVRQATIVRWLVTKALIGFRVGRSWRITKRSIVNFMQRSEVRPSGVLNHE